MNKQRGFTLVELVTVIILIGILAVNVLPRFDGTSSYEAHTHRAQLISALRLTQQRAMQQTGDDIEFNNSFCHQLIIEDSRYGIDDRNDCNNTNILRNDWQPDSTGHIVEERYNITFRLAANNPSFVSFDWLGKPLADCAGGCTIFVDSAVESLEITIEAEGYIHGSL